MKKIISLVLVLLMAVCTMLAFTGCSEGETLVCGVTILPKMNEQDADGNWTGFETEFAQEVGKILGMKVKFQVIDWGQKYNELNSGKIDCIWNGFTRNSSDEINGEVFDRADLVDFSYSYMLNQQCVVVKADRLSEFANAEALAGKTAAVETGSAGATYAKSVVCNEDLISDFPAQISTFNEIKSGRSDFAVVDILLAKNVCGQGDFTDLAIVESIKLESEVYAIGFKKGSDLTEKVNAAIRQLNENGKLLEIAQKYGLENSLQVTYD